MAVDFETARLIATNEISGHPGRTSMWVSPDLPGYYLKEIVAVWDEEGYAHQGYDQALFEATVGRDLAMMQEDDDMAEFVPRTTRAVWRQGVLGSYTGFIVMPKVTGEELPDVTHIDAGMAPVVDRFFAAAIRLGIKNPRNGKIGLPDLIDLDGRLKPNLKLGRVFDDEEDHPYSIDSYPVLVTAYTHRHHWDGAFDRLSALSAGYGYPLARAAVEAFFSIHEPEIADVSNKPAGPLARLKHALGWLTLGRPRAVND